MGTVRVLSSSPVSLFEVFSSPSKTERRTVIVRSFKFTSASTLSAKSSPARAPVPAVTANNARFNCVFAAFTTAAICVTVKYGNSRCTVLGGATFFHLTIHGDMMGLPLCAISSNLKVVDRPDDTEEILDGLAREFFPLPRLNQTPHDRIGDFLERSVLQM